MRCRNATAEVRLRTFLSPCVDDCGPYGQCKLLRTHNYLYAACECKAGERAGVGSRPNSASWAVGWPAGAPRGTGYWDRGEHNCLLTHGYPLLSSSTLYPSPTRRVAGLGLHRQRRCPHLWVPAAVHTPPLPEQPHVFAAGGLGHSEPICAGSCCLHLHHVLLHGMQ